MILPPLIPAAITAIVWAAEEAGHNWNVHGDFLGVIFLFLVSLVAGAVIEVLALIKALPALAMNPAERTIRNVACTSIGVAFLLICVGAIVWLVKQ